MKLLERLFQTPKPRVVCPGGWVGEDISTDRLTANWLLEFLAPRLNGAGDFGDLPEAALYVIREFGIEVRMGVCGRRTDGRELDEWIESHGTPALRAWAAGHAAEWARTGIQAVSQYLWLVAPIEDGLSPGSERFIVDQLAHCAGILASHLHVGTQPVEDWQSVTHAFDPPRRTQHPRVLCAAPHLVPIREDYTTYLQRGSLREAKAVVPVLLRQALPSFSVWVSIRALSPQEARVAKRELMPSGTQADVQRPSQDRMLEHLRCQYQLTLGYPSPTMKEATRAALLDHGLDFQAPSEGFFGLRKTPKAFPVAASAIEHVHPFQHIDTGEPARGGLLLRSANHTPVVFDPFRADWAHVFVTGASNAGKDAFCWSLIAAHVAQGHPAWVIAGAQDVAGPHDLLGSRVHVVKTGLNPLALCNDIQDLGAMESWLLSLVASVVGDTDAVRARLQAAMWHAWPHRRIPLSLDQIRNALEHDADELAHQLADALAPYTRDGEHAAVFSGEPLDLGTNSVLVLDTSALPAAQVLAASLALVTMLQLYWEQRAPQQRKVLYLPILQSLAQDTSMHQAHITRTVERFSRRARLFNGCLVTAIDDTKLGDGVLAPTALRLVETSGWRILMQPSSHPPAPESSWLCPPPVLEQWKYAQTEPGVAARFIVLGTSGVAAELEMLLGEFGESRQASSRESTHG